MSRRLPFEFDIERLAKTRDDEVVAVTFFCAGCLSCRGKRQRRLCTFHGIVTIQQSNIFPFNKCRYPTLRPTHLLTGRMTLPRPKKFVLMLLFSILGGTRALMELHTIMPLLQPTNWDS